MSVWRTKPRLVSGCGVRCKIIMVVSIIYSRHLLVLTLLHIRFTLSLRSPEVKAALPGKEELLECYALYKQVENGPCTLSIYYTPLNLPECVCS